jgi:hypothetical protein
MTELLYSHPSAFEILKVPILMTSIMVLAIVAILILKGKMHVEESPKKDVRIIAIVAVCIISLMFGPFIVGRTIYAIEVATKNKTIIEIELPVLSGNNSAIYFYSQDKKIKFNHDKQKTEYLEEYFVGKLCEIECYKITKRVIRITLLE